jgi:hypothetical protein
MNKEQLDKVCKAIDKMLPDDKIGNKLTRRLYEDGIHGWQISYRENRDYFSAGGLVVRGRLTATEIATNRIEIENFGIAMRSDSIRYLGNDGIANAFDVEMNAAYDRLKGKING